MTTIGVQGTQFGAQKVKRIPAIIFTTSGWHAIAHICRGEGGDRGTAIENNFPDPWDCFPARVMKMVDYGIKHAGLEARVVGYKSTTGEELGVIIYLTRGNQEIGCYAHRIDRNERRRNPAQIETEDENETMTDTQIE